PLKGGGRTEEAGQGGDQQFLTIRQDQAIGGPCDLAGQLRKQASDVRRRCVRLTQRQGGAEQDTKDAQPGHSPPASRKRCNPDYRPGCSRRGGLLAKGRGSK